MRGRFTCRFGAIVAAEARTRNAGVIERGRRPPTCLVTILTVIASYKVGR